jgi:amidase
MANGSEGSRSLCERYLDRIQRLDRDGPCLRSVIELNPDALKIADERDTERRGGRLRGPLHGVPILVKDNIDTADSMQTTAGSLALEGSAAPRDAFVVRRLRSAGAVILGKTNLSEWANFRGQRSVSGWSSRGGLTRNPYATDRTACGSSSGSAVAVAADLCAAAVGTETDGSIICPAQTNGVVGIKPTVGLISRAGIIPISHSQDTTGTLTRTVADAAILLGVLASRDPRDPATLLAGADRPRGYRGYLDARGLRDARIGVARGMAGTDARVLAVFETCLEALRGSGAVLVDPVSVEDHDKLGEAEIVVLRHELKADLNRYLETRGSGARVRTLEDVVRFNEEHRARVMPYFGQEHMIAAAALGTLASPAYRQARATNRRRARFGIDRALKHHRLDAIAVPSGGPAWLIDLVLGDAPAWDMTSTTPAAVAGYPHITVPAGYIHGLPVGLSLFSGPWREGTLIRLAYAFEQATQVRRPPQYLPHAPV